MCGFFLCCIFFFQEKTKYQLPYYKLVFVFSLSVLSGSDAVWIPVIVRTIRGGPVFVLASREVRMKAQANGIKRYFNGKSGDVIEMKIPKVKTCLRLTFDTDTCRK